MKNKEPDHVTALSQAVRRAFQEFQKAAGISRNEWQKKAGVSENYPKQIIEGSIASPTLEKAYLLCSGLGKTLWDLLEAADPNGAIAFRTDRTQKVPLTDEDPGAGDMNAEQMVLRRLARLEAANEKMAKEVEVQGHAIVDAIRELGDRILTERIHNQELTSTPKRNSRPRGTGT